MYWVEVRHRWILKQFGALLLAAAASQLPLAKELKEVELNMQADRLPPPDVAPIIIGQTKYEVIHWAKDAGFRHNGGYISATDAETGTVLWFVEIYSIEYDEYMEEDGQDIFIKEMRKMVLKNAVEITDEIGRKYLLDLDTRGVLAK